MNDHDVEISIYRILSGKTFFNYDNIIYLLRCPSIDIKYKALLLYQDIINEEKYQNWIRSDNYENIMISLGIWDKNTNSIIQNMYSGLDALKVELYKTWMMPSKQKPIRKKITHLKNELNKLLSIKQRFFEHTLEGYAESIRHEFLLCETLYSNNKLVFDYHNKSNEKSYTKFNMISQEIDKISLSLADIKSIARSELWGTYWNCHKACPIFNGNIAEWTDEQRLLYSMSRMYENIREHPECPEDKVIKDDDMLDGWMIEQRREQQKNKKRQSLDSRNKNLNNAKEVFLFPSSKEEFSEIMDLNDTEGKMIIKERMNFVSQQGRDVQEYELPDVQRDIRAELRQLNKGK